MVSCSNRPSNLHPDVHEASLPDVAEDAKSSLRNLLLANQHVFAFKTSHLGSTGLVKHVIDTQGLDPIHQRPYRASPHQKEVSKKIIEELLANSIIRPSLFPWATQIAIVKKNTEDDRLCIDYRKLNAVTKKDSFPFSRINDVLGLLYGQQCFSTLDLASGRKKSYRMFLDCPTASSRQRKPQIVKELQSFLVLASYYRGFIKGFFTIQPSQTALNPVLGSLLGLNIPYCRYLSPCSWLAPPQLLRRDIEMGPQVNPRRVTSAPVTIVNIPTPPTPSLANIAERPPMNHQTPSAMKKRVTKPMDYKELSSSTECGRVMTIKRAQPKQTRKVLPPFIPVQFAERNARSKPKCSKKGQTNHITPGPGEKLINQKPKVLKQPTEALSAKGSTRAAPSLSSGSLSSGEEYASEDDAMPNINLILSIINQSEDSLGDGDDDDLSQDEIEDEMEEEADQIVKSDERSESNGSLQESDQSANAVSYEIINNEEELLNALEVIGLQPEVSDVVGELNHPQKNLYVKRPDGVFIELTEEEIIKTITEKLSLMVPVNVAQIIIEMKNDISRIKHALELLAIQSPGLDETHQSIPSEFLFPLDSLPATLNLLGGTKIQEITRLILRALMGKALRLTYVAQKKNTGKKVFKETKMWPFVRDVIRRRYSEERKPDDQMILRSISTVLANCFVARGRELRSLSYSAPLFDIQERGVDIAALNDSIARHHGEKFNVSFVSSNYSLGSDEEDLATARYVESTYRIPSPRDREYRCPTLEWKGSETDAWSEEGEDWPRSSTSKLDEKWIGFPVEVAGGADETVDGLSVETLKKNSALEDC
ncbi:Uncharacterized protein APZ42_025096 [Daphnia magna]|uniref:Reverse transcriptase/retrotransposon-derived protein RNase H-like domain-containing protein n=1 Tax=Daphnia magna TaxID=35525 RepID=A0A164TGY2_9CRUS|nr:Uncharacterized protein APZ42_025096 [Daphnia magna]